MKNEYALLESKVIMGKNLKTISFNYYMKKMVSKKEIMMDIIVNLELEVVVEVG